MLKDKKAEELDGYQFDPEFIHMYGDGDGLECKNQVSFLLQAGGKPDLYLHLFNHHNGYYSHGFSMGKGEEKNQRRFTVKNDKRIVSENGMTQFSISLPEDLVAGIEQAAAACNHNRSNFIASVLKAHLDGTRTRTRKKPVKPVKLVKLVKLETHKGGHA